MIKSSSDTTISGNNSCYTLGGAIYAIYESEAEAQAEINALAMITTDSNGESETVDLAAGNYYLKELSAPRGYALSNEVIAFTVSAGETAIVRVSDVPTADPVPVLLKKIDEVTGQARPAGGMSLAGAEYTVNFYGGQYGTAAEAEASGNPLRSWVLRTDEDGYADIRDPAYIISGDELWQSASGEVSFPLGSVVIYETKAPTGYKINNTHYLVNITEDGQSSSVVRTYNAPEIPEEPYLGGVTVRKSDVEQRTEQGDATFAGTVFGLVNENSQSVTINGIETEPGGIALLIETNADGVAVSGQVIPCGSYSLREVQPPEGYELNAEWSSGVFTIEEEGQVVDAGTCADSVVRGGLAVQKLDSDTLTPVPQGGATLAGAEIQIRNASEKTVIVKDVSYEVGAVVATITTDESGVAETEDNLLPYGRYELVETKAPRGYGINLDWNPTVEVRESAKTLVTEGLALVDDVARGDISFIKVDGTNMQRLQNIPFRITSQTTGESHIVVTDVNGCFNSAELDKTDRVNQNDVAVVDGNIDESMLNSSCGVWFSGSNANSMPKNEKGAFPYDTYIFQELQTSVNTMYEMVSFEVTVTLDGQSIDLGTVDDNPVPHVFTVLLDRDTTDHIAEPGEVTLNDRVDYHALRVDKTYEIIGTLIDRDSGTPVAVNGETIRVTSGEFSPEASDGSVTLFYSFDAEGLEGKTVVSAVDLLENGTLVYSDGNLENPDETVHFPSIRTVAHGLNGEKEFLSEGTVQVIDTVTYSNLIPGITYTVSGQLVDASTGKAPIDADGNTLTITAETTFQPENESGTVDVEFSFDASGISGGTLVAFESLLRNSVVIAEHKDIGDEDQTITIPRVSTILKAPNNSHIAPAESEIRLTDTVTYSGLKAGTVYVMSGVLMDKSSGEKVKDVYGQEVTASRSFIADPSGAGTVELTFVFNGKNLAGTAVVAFEEVSNGGYIIAPLKGFEFYRACSAIGGQIIQIAPGSAQNINIMEIRKKDTSDSDIIDGILEGSRGSILVNKVQQLHRFFSLLIPDLTAIERQILDETLVRTYGRFGITSRNKSLINPNGNGEYKTMPVLGDLHKELEKAGEDGKRLYNLLTRFVTGSAKSFNQPTNVNLENKFVVIDVSLLTEELLPIGMFIALDFVMDKAQADRTKRKIIAIDEMWKLMRGSKMSAEFVVEVFKIIRGYAGSAIGATQDLADVLANEAGAAIINNSKTKLLLPMDKKEAEAVARVIDLTNEEMKQLKRTETQTATGKRKASKALMVANSNHIFINIKASKKEHDLITTSADDLRRLRSQTARKS